MKHAWAKLVLAFAAAALWAASAVVRAQPATAAVVPPANAATVAPDAAPSAPAPAKPDAPPPSAAVERIEARAFARGAFELRWYLPPEEKTVGAMVLGSGDGGWSYWEERVARHFCAAGWVVAGVDFKRYAETDFTPAILRADYGFLSAELVTRVKGRDAAATAVGPAPLVYAGWSMGAEHAIVAAADPATRPAGLRGLLLVAPGERGRYGLRTADKLGFAPSGDGTFALADFAPQLAGVRLAQFHAGLDLLDSITWQDGLKLDFKLFLYPRAFHDFDGAGNKFLTLLDEGLAWVLAPAGAPPRAEKNHAHSR